MSAFFTTISTIMLGHNELQIYTVCTLVDITNTGVIRDSTQTARSRNQQRNWETVLQAFALRSLPVVVQSAVATQQNLDNHEFGSNYEGEHLVWAAKIGIETHNLYNKNNDLASLLKDDFSQVPIITRLNETVKFPQDTFICSGASKNIYFIIG